MIGLYNIIALLISILFKRKSFEIGKSGCLWQFIGYFSFFLPGLYFYLFVSANLTTNLNGILYSSLSSLLMYILMIKLPAIVEGEKMSEINPDILDDDWE